ncbi:hypothetical protein [Kitasatospora sp. NBC_01302]|uniref:hypothetical protein n=1 Tax=Kitasatospora sp. NBC_01302 TaxID=2903575 RepID=UPI002E0FDA83|nr:hypothetical protein OG294_39225 [Kitasatospora sp. NBC_01302]
MTNESDNATGQEPARAGKPRSGGPVGPAVPRMRRLQLVGAATAVLVLATMSACSGHTGGHRSGHAAAGATPAGPPSAPATPSTALSSPTASPAPGDTATAAGSPSPTGGAATGPAVPSTAATPAPSGPLVPVTAPALLAAVVQALPTGLTADHFEADPPSTNDPYPSVYAQVHTPDGTGQLGVSMYPSTGALTCPDTGTCPTDPAGDPVQVQHEPGNCIQNTVITVQRHEGFTLAVQISSCLLAGNTPAVPALTQDQATALAGNPALTTKMPASYVQSANAQYPHLPLV